TPGGVVAFGEDAAARNGGDVVAFRAEVVVHDVQQHRETFPVRRVDQPLQLPGSAVCRCRGEQVDAVVSPVARTREVRDRHQLERGRAELRDVTEPFAYPGEGTRGRERADVQLVDDQILERDAGPFAVGPCKIVGIHDL